MSSQSVHRRNTVLATALAMVVAWTSSAWADQDWSQYLETPGKPTKSLYTSPPNSTPTVKEAAPAKKVAKVAKAKPAQRTKARTKPKKR